MPFLHNINNVNEIGPVMAGLAFFNRQVTTAEIVADIWGCEEKIRGIAKDFLEVFAAGCLAIHAYRARRYDISAGFAFCASVYLVKVARVISDTLDLCEDERQIERYTRNA